MRLRLQIVLPALVGIVVAAGFILAAANAGNAVRETLLTVPGITRDRAVEAAVAAVTVAGMLVTAAAMLASALLTRMVVRRLERLRRAADRLIGSAAPAEFRSFLGEIQDVADGFNRAAGELRDRHMLELRERFELRALVDAVSEGILQVDVAGRIARVNPAGRALLGLPAGALGQPVSSLLRNAALREVMERAASGEIPPAAEVFLDDRRVLASVAPQEGGGVVATFVDLTDLRRLEEVRRDFVANASHELKTPLTSIRGYTDTLLTGDLEEDDRNNFLAVISRNADRLQRIVDDLLDLSRLESGRWHPDLEPVDVEEVAQTAWSPFVDRAAEGEVMFRIRSRTKDRAIADRHALEQVFSNLFDNALRYTPAGGRIDVSSRAEDTGPELDDLAGPADDHPVDRWIAIEVADTGAGIPRDAIHRIFERFYRVDPARSRAEGGTGLGLSIVKHMVDSMGGFVRARSALGKGTTMTVWLRAAEQDLEDRAAGHRYVSVTRP